MEGTFQKTKKLLLPFTKAKLEAIFSGLLLRIIVNIAAILSPANIIYHLYAAVINKETASSRERLQLSKTEP